MTRIVLQSFVIAYHLIQNVIGMALIAQQTKSRLFFTYGIVLLGSIVAALACLASSYLFCSAETCLFSYTPTTLIVVAISYFLQLLLWHWWFYKRHPYAWLWLLVSHGIAYVVCYVIFNFGSILGWLFS